MKTLFAVTKRNIKVFFKDKGLFFTSLITPLILLVLYATFLANVYKDSFAQSAGSFEVPEKLINGIVGGELFSSLLAVSCVTVAFCSNTIIVQDKMSGARNDFLVSPVKSSVLSLSYFVSTFLSTIIVTFVATGACFIYIAVKGWYLSFADVLLVLSDVVLLTLFGTAFSSLINGFLTSSGQAQGIGTIVSAGYGFICGAYLPIASFPGGLQKVLSFLPGTYGTSLLRNHALNGALNEMSNILPADYRETVLEKMRDGIDCNIYFFGAKVEIWVMYLVLIGATLLFAGLYVLLHNLKRK